MLVPLTARAAELVPSSKPNFILILCDNLGCGDVACFNPRAHQRTALNVNVKAWENTLRAYWAEVKAKLLADLVNK